MKAPLAVCALLWLLLPLSLPAAGLPPGEAKAKETLNQSPRHGEYADVKVAGYDHPVKTYVVFPERKDKAPVVIVIQEVFGLTDWIRAVADQLAADGFLALAPDLLSGKGPNGGGTESVGTRDDAVALTRGLKPDEVIAKLNAVRAYGIALPAARDSVACVGFCWGGATSFQYAIAQPELKAAVVYYGTNPSQESELAKINAPILGLYGADDARVTSTIEPAAEIMRKLGRKYTYHLYESAGHGFLRAQGDREGANRKAAEQAWPATIEFLKKHTQ